MKNTFKVVSIAFAAILAISTAACGGGKSINSPEALKAYLDSKPANSPDKPIKVTINANDQMLREISRIIKRTGKYVSLTLSGNALTTIPGFSFNDSASLITSITIPNGVTSIGGQAFPGCIFTSITIPASVTSIGENSFSWCRNLTSVTFAPTSKVTIIEDEAFAECSSLTSVTIPDSVNSIGRAAFRGCTSLASVTIPKSGTSIGRYAFLGDLQIKYIAGGIGTYKTNAPVGDSSVWTKQ